ncbi:MAG TPA: sigma 54-interacting transcriptional regulator [Polyangia bacterium]
MPDTREAETRRAAVYRGDGGGGDRASLRLVVYGPGSFNAYPLPPAGTLTLGRSTSADVPIDDPDVSRQHARLHVGGTLEIEDLGSANGTKCHSVPLAPHERRPIAPGDVIALGTWLCVVQTGSGPLFLWTESAFVERVQKGLADAARSQRELVLLHLAVDGVAAAPAVEDILRATLGAADVVAALAPGRFDILAPRLSPAAAAELGDRLCRQLRELGFAPRLASATHPQDGATAVELVQHARRQLGPDAAAETAAHPSMARLEALVARVAPGNINVLLLGETGVGKEVLAERIHQLSPRAPKPLLRLHCAALSESLLESELFGHERGAFTGALKTKRGLLETADGGTIFLDEIGELPLSIQVKLLRVIEERKVLRVGGLTAQPIDVRFIAATNRNLDAEIPRGTFRQDLYYRLNGISLVIPPLRERAGEIEPLAQQFIRQASAAAGRAAPLLSPAAEALLRARDWPGNIRELRNVCERAVLLCIGDVIEPEHLSLQPDAPPPSPPAHEVALTPEAQRQRDEIVEALARCAGNQSRAAKLLGISRKTLVARLDAFALPRPRKPSDPR